MIRESAAAPRPVQVIHESRVPPLRQPTAPQVYSPHPPIIQEAVCPAPPRETTDHRFANTAPQVYNPHPPAAFETVLPAPRETSDHRFANTAPQVYNPHPKIIQETVFPAPRQRIGSYPHPVVGGVDDYRAIHETQDPRGPGVQPYVGLPQGPYYAPRQIRPPRQSPDLDRIHENGHPDIARFTTEAFREFHEYLTKSSATGRSLAASGEEEEKQVKSPDAMTMVMEKLLEMESIDQFIEQDALSSLLMLCKMSIVRDQECVQVIKNAGFAALFKKFLKVLKGCDWDINDQINHPAEYLAFNLLLDAVQRFTEHDAELCRQVGGKVVADLLDFVRDDFFDVDALNKDDDELKWMSRRELLKKIFTILYNCIRNYPDNRKIFRKHQATETLRPFLDCRFFILRAKALFILAYVVTEEENEYLNTTSINIEFIVKILRKALEDPNHYSAHYNFFALEVVEAVKYVAVNDNNKFMFLDAGVLEHLVSMVNENNSLEERKGALDAVWMLSFLEAFKTFTNEKEDFINYLKSCQDIEELKQSSRAILWNLGLLKPEDLPEKSPEENIVDEGSSATKSDSEGALPKSAKVATVTGKKAEAKVPHVMISYQWDVQKQIIRVKDILKAHGFNVWLDLERMGGSTLEAMASAVEEAVVIIICFSEKYKDSTACRTEAEYTYKLKKPIVPLKMQKGYDANGWLGAMLGTKLYIEMQDIDLVEKNMTMLIRELDGRGRYPQPDQSDDDEEDEDDDDTSSFVTRQRSGSVHVIQRRPMSPPPARIEIPATRVERPNDPLQYSPGYRSFGTPPPHQQEYRTVLPATPPVVTRVVEASYSIQVVRWWDSNDVHMWLRRNNLQHALTWFGGYRGRDLLELKQLADAAPEFFYRKMETEFGFGSLLDMFRFKQMLDDIK